MFTYFKWLTKSWSSPAALKFATKALINTYYPTERACLIQANDKINGLNFSIEANTESPIENPAFVIKNWGNREVDIKVDGLPVARSKIFRYGFRDGVEGTDLIIYLEKKGIKKMAIEIVRKK